MNYLESFIPRETAELFLTIVLVTLSNLFVNLTTLSSGHSISSSNVS